MKRDIKQTDTHTHTQIGPVGRFNEKNNTFYYQNSILEVVPASQKSNKIKFNSNFKTKDLNFTGHMLFHCHNCSKREGMAMHTCTIHMIKKNLESKFRSCKKKCGAGT